MAIPKKRYLHIGKILFDSEIYSMQNKTDIKKTDINKTDIKKTDINKTDIKKTCFLDKVLSRQLTNTERQDHFMKKTGIESEIKTCTKET